MSRNRNKNSKIPREVTQNPLNPKDFVVLPVSKHFPCVSIFDLPDQDCCAVGCEEDEEVGEKEGKGGHLEKRK